MQHKTVFEAKRVDKIIEVRNKKRKDFTAKILHELQWLEPTFHHEKYFEQSLNANFFDAKNWADQTGWVFLNFKNYIFRIGRSESSTDSLNSTEEQWFEMKENMRNLHL